MTDNEIVKMLECCKQEIDSNGVICGECKKCPNYEGETGLCKEDLPTVVLDLINRQKEEKEALINGQETLQKYIAEQKAEIEKLKENLNIELEKYATEYDNIIKTEAYKEFAERVHCHCESIINQEWNKRVGTVSWADAYEQFDNEIDNLLKELVGENNAG